MNSTEARRRAEQLFTRKSADQMTGPDCEARAREVQQKIEYLRQLRLAAQARRAPGIGKSGDRRRIDTV